MGSKPADVEQPVRFGEGYELEVRPRRLRRGRHVIRLERIPLEILVLLVERKDEVVTRDEIVSRVWGKGVFLDTDNSIRGAIRKLRQALKDDAGSPRFIQTITGQGYRFMAPTTSGEEASRSDATAPETSTAHRRAATPVLDSDPLSLPWEDRRSPAVEASTASVLAESNRRARIWLLAAAVLLFGLVGFAAYKVIRSRAPGAKFAKIASVAVMPLKNLSGDPAQEYLADGMTEELIGRLSTIHGLRVISRTSIMQFKNTRLLTPDIAKTLAVDALVEGSVIREGNRLRVHAQLIRASMDEHFWSETYDRELGDALTLESEVAESITRKVEVTVTGEERARLVAARPVSPEAYESYLKGLAAKGNTRAEVQARIAYFDEAIRRDPTFAPAYVGLANAYNRLGSIVVGAAPSWEIRPKVISAAQRALELDPDLSKAHVLLGDAHMGQWHWAEAKAEFRRALDLNPNDPLAHDELAEWDLSHGHVEEALAWARREREIDPLGGAGYTIAWILFCARRYDEAIREFRNELAVRPEDGLTLWNLGFTLVFNDQPQKAIRVQEKAISVTHRSPGVISALVWAYARDGRRADALRLLKELKRREKVGYVPAAAMVNSYLALGDNDEAFAWFERAREEPSNLLRFIKVFPPFDPVRGDPRFQDLIRRVRLN